MSPTLLAGKWGGLWKQLLFSDQPVCSTQNCRDNLRFGSGESKKFQRAGVTRFKFNKVTSDGEGQLQATLLPDSGQEKIIDL